jgi:hypothetical protein
MMQKDRLRTLGAPAADQPKFIVNIAEVLQ